MGVLSTILIATLVCLLGAYLFLTEFLDTIGRLEIIEKRWPKAWAAMSNRPMRLVLLILLVVLVAKDVNERLHEMGPPPLKVVMPSIPAPIVQFVQTGAQPATSTKQTPPPTIGTIKQGDCGVVQSGGSNNVASPNCAPADRRLNKSQADIIAAAARSICLSSPAISVTASNANQEAQRYAEYFVEALNREGCHADLALPIPGLKPDVVGVSFAIRGRPGLNANEAQLYQGLKSAGIEVGIHPLAPDFFSQESFVLVIGARQ